MRSISCHVMPLVIDSQGADTHTHALTLTCTQAHTRTHTHIHTHVNTHTNFMENRRTCTWLKILTGYAFRILRLLAFTYHTEFSAPFMAHSYVIYW